MLALACGALGCSVIDGSELEARGRPDSSIAADGGNGNGDPPDATGPQRPDAQAGAGAGGSRPDPGTAGSNAPPDSGPDPTPTPNCTPNPDDPSCPERCDEQCNGVDDDCDGVADEVDADFACNVGHTTSLCSRGSCLVIECLDDYRDCDGNAQNGCEIAPDDVAHCGRCGFSCELPGALESCVAGECVASDCEPGLGDCDGDALSCETTLATLDHCGGCDVPCTGLAQASPQCDSGSCGVKACLGNFGDCDHVAENGCETPLDSFEHCGGCETACAKASCGGGVCTAVLCPAPSADCDRDEVDCEVDLSTDVANCGGCGRPCAFSSAQPRATLACAARTCQAQCDAGYGNCDEDYADGCETALASTPAHCGACGRNCSTVLAHVAQTSCSSNNCGIVTCQSGWGDCDKVASNGCERNTAVEGPCLPDASCTAATNGTHEYFFCSAALGWDAARARCKLQARGDLVNIASMAENDFIRTQPSTNAWIGARDVAIEGLWRWDNNGLPFWRGGAAGSAQQSRFARWSSGQPDDAGSNEDCAEFWADGSWNDGVCGGAHPYICERQPDECPSDANK
ncbi:MAG TPA: lectin-like protein, partial [Conexibacter sp.]|nr:lectin-like protein [Conexibacter sp.]